MWWFAMGAVLAHEALAQDLFRVDQPDVEGALVSSHRGSLLSSPPADLPWRMEPVPVTDEIVGDYAPFSAGDVLGAERWHSAGFKGQGVKAAVFDVKWFGVEISETELGDVETHDCFSHIGCTEPMDTLRPRFSFEVGVHGMACAEVIRDLAPDVDLHLVRVNGLTTFENAVAWAVREEVDVVSLSMSFFNDSFYGDGQVAAAVEELVEAGILLVTSAGNYATGHFHDTFLDTDGDGYHEFPWGSESLPIDLPAGEGRVATLQWDDDAECGRNDLDLVLLNRAGNRVGIAERKQDREAKSCSPVERLDAFRADSDWYWMKIRRDHGVEPVRLNVYSTRGRVYRSMAEGSVPEPGSHPRVLAVGAVRADGYLWNQVESFSSQGPTLAGLAKPDLVAPDGVSTSVYGPDGFFGTSAAAPMVVGAVVLWMSRDPGLSSFEAGDALQRIARPEGALWEALDPAFGAGRLILGPPTDSARETGCWGRGVSTGWFGLWLPWFIRRRRQEAMPGWMR